MVLPLLLERVEKDFCLLWYQHKWSSNLKWHTWTIISFSKPMHTKQDNNCKVAKWSFPQSFVVFFFLARIPLVSLMLLSVHPIIYSVRQPASYTRNPAKKGRGQTCDIFWAMYVYVTQQGSFPSKMEIACIAAAVSYGGSTVERVGENL